MSNQPKRNRSTKPQGPPAALTGKKRMWFTLLAAILTLVAGAAWLARNRSASAVNSNSSAQSAMASNSPLPTVEVAQSLMSTLELDFGRTPPPMHEAIKEIERSYQPDGGGPGRTFAVLDADGAVTANGKLRIQMHLSMERPGVGSLIFRRTGEVLWRSRIVASSNGPAKPKQMVIYMANASGQSFLLDGSKGLRPVLDLPIDKAPGAVRDHWPDGAEHEFTFIYSVCGCPVKAKVRRTGEITARTSQLPVMFPDDPSAMRVINQMMGWPASP